MSVSSKGTITKKGKWYVPFSDVTLARGIPESARSKHCVKGKHYEIRSNGRKLTVPRLLRSLHRCFHEEVPGIHRASEVKDGLRGW